VVITGASRGIGAGLAADFHARGIRLGVCARGPCPLAGAPRVLARSVDVADPAAVEQFAAEVAVEFGAIDLWINNAGVLAPVGPLREIDPAAFHAHVAVNLHGVFHGSRTFARHRRLQGGGGVLINVSSGAAWHGYSGWSPYCASKAGVDRLSECLALEEAAVGLRVHAVAPGVIDTAMQELIRASNPADFPDVGKFLEMKALGSFNSIPFVAQKFLEIAFDGDQRPAEVVLRLPMESEAMS